MKTLFALILLAALGAGGWYWYHHRDAPAARLEADGFGPDGFNAGSVTASTPTLAPTPVLPLAVQQGLAQADAEWAKAGADPVRSPQAPELSRLYSRCLYGLVNQPDARARTEQLLRERLQPLAETLFFSKTPFNDDPLFATHVVQPRESPEVIAKKYGMSREFLNRLRGRDANDSRLNAGESLKVVRLAAQTDPAQRGFHLVIDKSDYLMDLYIAGMFTRRYTISHGADKSPTPLGHTHVVNRVWHPDWTHPETKRVIPYGDPDHLLGPIWLAFDAKEYGRSGIGIHGYTGADAKWGDRVSNGCIRLPNEQAVELYELIGPPERAPIAVEIVE